MFKLSVGEAFSPELRALHNGQLKRPETVAVNLQDRVGDRVEVLDHLTRFAPAGIVDDGLPRQA